MTGNKTQSVALIRIMEIYPELLDILHTTIDGLEISEIYYKDRDITPDALKLDVTGTFGNYYHIGITSAENQQFYFDHTIMDICINEDDESQYFAILKLSENRLRTDTCVELFKQGIEIHCTDIDGEVQILDRVGILRKHTIDKIASYHEDIR